MIERPKRSVTRFFIPLIDVLILLFCIFLLMPFMSQPGAAESDDVKPATNIKDLTPEEMRHEIAGLRIDLNKAKRDMKKMQEERINPTERISVCVLEIEPKNGQMIFYRRGERVAVSDQRGAQEIIDEHKRRSGIGKDPFFLIRMPHELTNFPSRPQMDQYENWFKDVPHRFDDPFSQSAP